MSIATSSLLASTSLLRAGMDPLQRTATLDPAIQPAQDGSGYDVSSVAIAAYQVAPSGASPGRRWVATVDTLDAASTYSLVVGSVTATSATPADAETLWTDLLNDLAPGLLDDGWTVQAIDGDGEVTTTPAEYAGLFVEGPADTALSWTASAGSPTLALTADAATLRARIYTRRSGDRYGAYQAADSTGWGLVADLLVDGDGARGTIDVGGEDSARIWVTDAAAAAGDTCTPGAVTVATPAALVLPCIRGESR